MNSCDINGERNFNQESYFQKELEEKCKEINILKLALQKKEKFLEERDQNLMLAAQYGKELLEKNAVLHENVQDCNNKIEDLQQDKYTLSMKLETSERTVKSLTAELEIQEKFQNDNHKKKCDKLQDEHMNFKKQISLLENKKETLENELKICKEKCYDLEQMLEKVQKERLEASQLNTTQSDLEEYTNQLQHQINALTVAKQDLEKEVLDLRSLCKKSDVTIQNNENIVARLQTELEEKECHITSKYNEIERLKTEIEELKIEIDQMKLKETDPNKKGNSLFAELEDNRQLLEKQVISMNAKYTHLKSQVATKSEEIKKLKLYIVTLFGINSNPDKTKYQEHLEETLKNARYDIKVYADKYRELEDKLKNKKCLTCQCENMDKQGKENFMKYLLEESQKSVRALEEEVQKMLFKKISAEDQNLQLNRKLNQIERERDVKQSEIIQLNVRIDELLAVRRNSSDLDYSEVIDEEKFHYEEIPKTKVQSEDKIGEKSSKILREKFIQAEDNDKRTVLDETLKVFTEEPPSKIFKKDDTPTSEGNESKSSVKKEVKFADVNYQENEVEQKREKETAPKVRRRMEAPHVVVNSGATDECQVQ